MSKFVNQNYLAFMILPEQPEFITIDEAARALGVSERTIRRWEDKGILTSLLDLAGTKRKYFKKDIEKLFSANQSEEFPSNSSDFLTIDEAARALGVSERTLRRWEERGILTPIQDHKRNKHRYAKEDVDMLLNSEHIKNNAEPKEFEFIEVYNKESKQQLSNFAGSKNRIFFAWGIASIVLLLVGSSFVLGLTKSPQDKNKQPQFARSGSNNVLGVATGTEHYSLRVNTPAFFNGNVEFLSDVTIQGNIIAKNVLNSLSGGEGISVSSGQNPTITNTGVTSLGGSTGALSLTAGSGITVDGLKITNSDAGSSQDIFKNIKVGSSTITAGSNSDTVTLAAGTGITLTPDTTNKTITIDSMGGNSGGVTSLNSQTGAVTLSAGSGLSLSGLTFSNAGVTSVGTKTGDITLGSGLSMTGNQLGNSGVLSLGGSTGALSLTGGSGISVSGLNITNTDLGSSQNIFKNITVGGVPTSASSNNDTLNIASGSGITVTTDTSTKTLTIASTITNSTIQSVSGWTQSGNNVTLTNLSNSVGIGTSSPLTALDVRGNSGVLGVASVSGATSFASLVTDNSGTGDLFTASKSGATKFTILNNGNLNLYGTANFPTTLAFSATGAQTITFPDATGTVCLSTNNCGYLTSVPTNWWTTSTDGKALAPINGTMDFLLGGVSTSAAKFAVTGLNLARGSQTATLSGSIVLDSAGSLQTTKNQTLTLGGNTTGNIQFKPGNSSSSLYLASSGNVGIGTTSPTAALDVTGNANISGSLTVNGSLVSGSQWQGNSGVIAPANIANDLAIGGTSTSSALFHVLGTSGNLNMLGTAVIAPTANAATALTLRAPSTGTANILNITDSTGTNSFMSVDSTGALTLGGSTFSNSGAIHLTNSSNAIMSTAIEGAWTMNSNTFTYRRNVTVVNNDPINVLPSGYQITIVATGSAAADICSATRSDSNDIRVSYGSTEIARNITRTCSTEVDISFKTSQNISASSSDSSYYIYYGNSALATAGSTYSYSNLTLDSADNVANWSASPTLVSLTQETTIKQQGTGSVKVQAGSDGVLTASSSFATDTGSSLPTGLVSYWKFDEASGSIISDSASTNDGVVIGTSVASGLLNNARSFSGNSSNIGRVASPSNLPTGAAPRSVFAWVKPTSSGTSGSIISYGLNSSGRDSSLDIISGKAYFGGFSNDLSGTTSLVGGTWYLIGYTYDGTTVKVYVNGVLDASGAKTLNTASSDIGIGYELPQSTFYYNGLIDEAGIWSKALSQQEITDLYHTGTPDAYTAGYNISTQNNTGRSCADGGDAVGYPMTATASAGASSITLASTPSAGCLSAGDEVLVANMQGTSADNSNVGKYELKTISSVAGATLNLTATLINTYDGVGQKIMVQRVPHYSSVTVAANSQLTASAWNGSTGGVLFFRSAGPVTVNGHLNADSIGFRGGTAGTGVSASTGGQNGESYDGNVGSGGILNTQGTSGGGNGNGNNTLAAAGTRGGGGGGGGTTGAQGDESSAGGGGGGYAGGGAGGGGGTDSNAVGKIGGSGGAVGVNAGGGGGSAGNGGNAGSAGASVSGTGGAAGSGATTGQGGGSSSTSYGSAGGGGGGLYGTSDLSKLYLGSGGGGGAGFSNQTMSGIDGRAGGGILGIIAPTVTVSSGGSITANGGNAWSSMTRGGSGGAGSGGSILIYGGNVTTNSSINADGGSANSSSIARGGGGGGGGEGIVAVSGNSITGTTSPTYGSINSTVITNNFYPYSATLTLSPADLSTFAGLNSYFYTATAGASILTEFSNDGGSTWQTSSPLYTTSANTWNLLNYDISGVSASSRNNVTKVRFRFSSDPGTLYFDNVYAAVSNFTGTTPGNTLANKTWGAANLILNAQGTGYVQLNYDSTNTLQAGTGGVRFYNGGSTQVLGVDSSGNMTLANNSVIKPTTDSTTAFGIANTSGTSFVTFDTLNSRVAIGTSSAATATLDVVGNASIAGQLTFENGFGTIQTTNNQTFTLGGNTTGDIQFKPANSSSSLYLSSNGNVGIGTTIPGSKLEVKGTSQSIMMGDWTSTSYAGVSLNGSLSTGNYNLLSGTGDQNFYINRPSAKDIRFRENNSDQMTLQGTTGYLGIGTTNPSVGLDIAKNASDLLKLTSTTGGVGNKAYMDFQTYNGSGVSARIGAVDYGSYNAGLIFEVNPGNGNNSTVTSEAMRITQGGQVGIGTTSPIGALNVVGTSSGQALFNLNYLGTGQNLMTASVAGVTKFTLDTNGGITSSAGAQWKTLADSTTALQIANSAGSALMNFDTTNSKVGIGTSSPTQALDINGALNLFSSTNQRGDIFAGTNLDQTWNTNATFNASGATFSAGLLSPAVGNRLGLKSSGSPLTGWSYRKAVTVDNTGNPSSLTNYVISATIDTATLISTGKMNSDCSDMRFTDSDGTTLLSYWIESGCNSASTKVWVKVPSILGSSTKTIYFYYQNAAATSASSTASTFADDLSGVNASWSFEDATGSATALDTSGNGNTLTAHGTSVVGGKIYYGRNLVSASRDYLQGSATTNTDIPTNGSISLFAWIKTTGNGEMIYTYQNGGGTPLIYMSVGATTAGGTANKLVVYLRSDSGASAIPISGTTTINDGNWHLVGFTAAVSGSTRNVTLYVDGNSDGTAVWSTNGSLTVSPSGQLYIGGSNTSYSFNGIIDEVKFFSQALLATQAAELASNQAYTTTSYAGHALVKPYTVLDPTISFGAESGSFSTGDQFWTSQTLDAGAGNTYRPNYLTVNYTLDGSDNIAPKFQLLGSDTGAFTGEQTIYPAGPNTYYQAGGSYPISSGTPLDITAQVNNRFRYWKVQAYLNTGATVTDTPYVSSIRLQDYKQALSILANGFIGLGTTAPSFKLDVQDGQAASSTASITNLSVSSGADVLSLKVGTTSATTNNYFLTFLDGNGNIVGKVQGNGSGGVSYATTGVDFAEYFRKENKDEVLQKGDVVCIGPTGGATKCQNGTNILGVVSGKAGFVGGSQHDQDPNYVAVGLVGQLPVNVSSQSGKINPGDKLTIENGVVKTASSGGEILGQALEGYSGEGNVSINARINSGWYSAGANGSTSSSLSDLGTRLDLLSQSVNTLQNIINFNMASTPSAQLLSADSLDLKSATVSGSLMVLGKTTLGDVGITGKINSGLLVINGLDDSAVQGDTVTTINTLSGDLYLQNLGLGGIDILNGKVKIDKLGNITTQGKVSADKIETKGVSITSDQNISDGTIPAGKTQIVIYSTAMKKSSKVFITPTTQISVPLIVSNKNDGSFTVTISKSQTQGINFDWMIVGTQ